MQKETPNGIVPNLRVYPVNPASALCPRREDKVEKKEPLIQYQEISILKLLLVRWKG